jgi:hypothetical protein
MNAIQIQLQLQQIQLQLQLNKLILIKISNLPLRLMTTNTRYMKCLYDGLVGTIVLLGWYCFQIRLEFPKI